MSPINKSLDNLGITTANYPGASGQGAADLFGLSNVVILPPSTGSRILTSGNIGLRDDETVPRDLREEVEQVFKNVENALRAAGLGPRPWRNVYKLKIYVIQEGRDEIFETANDASKRYLEDTKPVIAAVVVPAILHPDARVELEVEAFLPAAAKL